MVLTAVERAKRFIQNLKERGLYEEFKNNRKALYKNYRDNVIKRQTPKQKQEQRALNTTRKRKQRQNKVQGVKKSSSTNKEIKSSSSMADEKCYGSNSAFRKAVSRANKALPKSLPKRKKVVDSIHRSLNGIPKPKISRCTGISDELRNAVIAFYLRDDVSRQSPGRKDYITIKGESGNKVKVQTKYLMFTLRHAFHKFCEENDNLQLSSFCELRPKHVSLMSEMPHNVCLCLYHDNFISALSAIRKVVPDFPKYDDEEGEFYRTFFCDEMTNECWANECINCKDNFYLYVQGVGALLKDINVKWYEWIEREGRQHKKLHSDSMEQLALYVSEIAPPFFQHCFFKRRQQESYKQCLADAKHRSDVAVIQLDYSENYKCVAQDEVSSAHWNQAQVTLFTVAVWIALLMKSYCLVSDDLEHSKSTIIPFLDRILEELPHDVKVVHIWSDGPSSQFKNKLVASTLPHLEQKYDIKIYWNFFATSHGKGPVDGIGGALKRQFWVNVKSRKAMVRNASEFVAAVEKTSLVTVILMTSDEIKQRAANLNLQDIWNNARSIVGISKFHHLSVNNIGKVVGRRTTSEI